MSDLFSRKKELEERLKISFQFVPEKNLKDKDMDMLQIGFDYGYDLGGLDELNKLSVDVVVALKEIKEKLKDYLLEGENLIVTDVVYEHNKLINELFGV